MFVLSALGLHRWKGFRKYQALWEKKSLPRFYCQIEPPQVSLNYGLCCSLPNFLPVWDWNGFQISVETPVSLFSRTFPKVTRAGGGLCDACPRQGVFSEHTSNQLQGGAALTSALQPDSPQGRCVRGSVSNSPAAPDQSHQPEFGGGQNFKVGLYFNARLC